MVCFQMEFNMFEHVFQDLKAVEDAVASFFSNAHNHLYHIVNCLEQASDSNVGSIGLKSYRRVLIHKSLSTPLSTLSVCAYRIVPLCFGVVGEGRT